MDTSEASIKPQCCESRTNCRLLNLEDFSSFKNNEIVKELFENSERQSHTIRGTTIQVLDSNDILRICQHKDIEKLPAVIADSMKSDLEARKYEGGMKIWDCTFDMLEFIEEKNLILKNLNVLDLGCGAGLIGILCLKLGANLCFQDFNHEVLSYYTFANIDLNNFNIKECEYFAGSWKCFAQKLPCLNKYDYIFTSETIYNVEDYQALHTVFEKSLKKNGSIYLAAKVYYFGIGGGTVEFTKFLDDQNIFKHRIIHRNSNGLGRVIMEIKYKDSEFLDE